MEAQQPLGQPINANPNDPQYVPQPLDGGSSKFGKKLWLIIAGIVGLLLILGVAYWFMGKGAAEQYKKDAGSYKQELKQVRDDMNTVLDEQNINIRGPKAPPIFEEYGKKMQDVIADAPKPPKVFGILPARGTDETKKQIDDLSQAATNYAGELRRIYSLFSYFTTVVDKFKPVKETTDIKALPGLWETFLTEFKAMQTLEGMEGLRDDLIKQGEDLLKEFKTLVSGLDNRSPAENSSLAASLNQQSKKFNETFQKSVQDSTNEAINQVNTYYDELDALLK